MIGWVQVTSGQGPDECCWVTAKVVEAMLEDASRFGCQGKLIDVVVAASPTLFRSALLSFEGAQLTEFLAQWQGTIQWIGKSPFRPHNKRKNWYTGVTVYRSPERIPFNASDLKYESMRSSGPGGQHVNKTESAIRVTHVPTGISVAAREERSQHMNRKLALCRLIQKLQEMEKCAEKQLKQEQWSNHSSLERGNPVRVYEGASFKLKCILDNKLFSRT